MEWWVMLLALIFGSFANYRKNNNPPSKKTHNQTQTLNH